jgi:restriction endonuclease S subunit
MAGTVGRCAIYEEDTHCNCNQAVAILSLNTDNICPEYLMHYLNSEIGCLFFEKLQHISDQPNINLNEIGQIQIILPDKPIQEEIVKRCKPIKNQIFCNANEMKNLKDNFDEPMRNAIKQNPTEYTKVLESNYYSVNADCLENQRSRIDFVANHPIFDWIRRFRESGIMPLGEFIDKQSFSYGVSESALESEHIGFLNVHHLSFEGKINFSPKIYIEKCPEHKKLKKDDILIARTGHTLGKSALITEEYEDFAFGSFCIRFRLISDNFIPEFVAQYINSIYGQAQIMLLKTGSGKNNINKEQIADIKIPELDKDAQIKILKEYEVELTNLASFEYEENSLLEKINLTIGKELYNK